VGALLVRVGGAVTGDDDGDAFRVAFVLLAVLLVLPLVEALLLSRTAGDAVTGHRPRGAGRRRSRSGTPAG
jgi:hypothetical protein